MRNRPKSLLGVLLTILLMLAACGGDATPEPLVDDTATTATAAPTTEGTSDTTGETEATTATTSAESPSEMTDVSFSAVPSMTSIGLHVANDLGFFEEEGINADIIDFDSGAAAEQAMLTGDVDFGAGGVVNSIVIAAAGQEVKNLALFQDSPIFSFVVRSDLAEEITTLEDLEGRTVGFSSPGSLTDFFVRLSLNHVGLDPDNDVDLVGTGGPPAHLAALEAEQVAVQLTWEPATTQIIESGVGQMLLDLRTDEAPPEIGNLIGSSVQALGTKIDESPELAEAVARAVVKADNAIQNDPAVLADALEAHLFPDLPRELIEQVAAIESQSFRPHITVEEVQAWIDAYVELGFLDAPIDPQLVLDDRFVEIWEQGR